MAKELEKFELGAAIGFSAPFTTPDGATLSPPAAKLYLKFKKAKIVTSLVYDMTMSGGVASYTWDTKADDPDPGVVGWYIESVGGTVIANDAGQFEIVAGIANPNV